MSWYKISDIPRVDTYWKYGAARPHTCTFIADSLHVFTYIHMCIQICILYRRTTFRDAGTMVSIRPELSRAVPSSRRYYAAFPCLALGLSFRTFSTEGGVSICWSLVIPPPGILAARRHCSRCRSNDRDLCSTNRFSNKTIFPPRLARRTTEMAHARMKNGAKGAMVETINKSYVCVLRFAYLYLYSYATYFDSEVVYI